MADRRRPTRPDVRYQDVVALAVERGYTVTTASPTWVALRTKAETIIADRPEALLQRLSSAATTSP